MLIGPIRRGALVNDKMEMPRVSLRVHNGLEMSLLRVGLRALPLLAVLLTVPGEVLHSQTRLDELNREKARLQALIEQSAKQLEEFATRRDKELTKISVVDNKIAHRLALIDVYKREVDSYQGEIRNLNHRTDSVEREVTRQKTEYAELLRRFQARGANYSPLAYILSSQSFNQGYQRYLFMRQYSNYRREQFAQLEQSMTTLTSLKGQAAEKLNSVNQLLVQTRGETLQLTREKDNRQGRITKLQSEQKDLEQQVREAERQTRSLEAQIAEVIAEEAEKARKAMEEARARQAAEAARKKAEQAKGKVAKTTTPTSPTPAAPAVAGADIAGLKGRLPWPVAKHVVTSAFGEHEHPLVPTIMIRNNGIDIDILGSAEVHPVHTGIVSRVIIIPGSNSSIIVRHGDILTVYSNLSEVNVKKGDKVTLATDLGRVWQGEGLNSNILHFELWQGESKQNPEQWLRK